MNNREPRTVTTKEFCDALFLLALITIGICVVAWQQESDLITLAIIPAYYLWGFLFCQYSEWVEGGMVGYVKIAGRKEKMRITKLDVLRGWDK